MKEKEYYNEIKHLAKKLEINRRVRISQENNETLQTYWNIGRLITEAQGGKTRAKYGNELIKKWSKELTLLYGKGYDTSNLKRFRQFYLLFQKGGTVSHQLSWSHYQYLLPIKDENKRNYYINQCIERHLSVRELRQEIKNNAFERLLEKPEKVEMIINHNKKYDLQKNLKNPILIHLNKEEKLLKEKDLQAKILAKIQTFFAELGQGFAFIDNEFKISINGKNYYIDLLLFNVETNCYVVIELKFRELKIIDKAQIEFYMNYIDKNLKREFHNKTIGIIISQKQDTFIVSFISDERIIPITYKEITIPD